MATAPPPPPPPPPFCTTEPVKSRPPPCPGHAAIPFISRESTPVHETSSSSETSVETEVTWLQGQEDNPSDSEDTHGPVQESDPAPEALNNQQVTEQQDEAATQMDQAGKDRLKP